VTRREPNWLTREVVEAIHELQLAQHGGLAGIRDAGALESALGRPKHQWHYQAVDDLAGCAAAYGFGIARNHAFSDGNKRTALVAMAVFLEINGLTFIPSEPEAVTTMLGVATGEIDEEALAAWLRGNTRKRRK